jgi:phage shock protein PspC (stress-responsive transcriptional regulator)
MSGVLGTARLGAMNRSDVQVTLREMWETRPARPREGRQIAGVAAAIARRYDIDPVLVRVGLVVAAFYGIGAALYIAGWVLLPDDPDEDTAGRPGARTRPKAWLLVALGIAAVVGVGHIAEGRGGILLPAAAVAALLFLLHRSRGRRGVAGPGTPGSSPTGGGTASGAPIEGDTAAGTTPPAWDPLGAAPFAWDLPEPGPAPVVAAPRRRSRLTPVTLAVALLAGGVTALVLLAAGGLTDLPVLLGVVLAVLGAGLVLGAFSHSGRGLIPVALLVGALTWGVLAAPLDRFAGDRPGDLRIAPVTAAALAPHYALSVGSVDMDLRGMDLSVPPRAAVTPVQTQIDAGMGSVDIHVPRDADVRFSSSAGLGSITFDDQSSDGPGAELTVNDLGADGRASGRPLVLDVEAGMGAVEVHRG